ncbi:MAG: PilZ domain-containing protein [Pyrinomonadaceae bacterium]
MPELIRSLVGRLREYASDRRRSPRRRERLPLTVSLHEANKNVNGRRAVPALAGSTRDISKNGLCLVVPAIRIGGHYLAGEDRTLRIVVELPSGPIQLFGTPVRYEPIEDESGEQGFMIGVKISEMRTEDRERLKSYLEGK